MGKADVTKKTRHSHRRSWEMFVWRQRIDGEFGDLNIKRVDIKKHTLHHSWKYLSIRKEIFQHITHLYLKNDKYNFILKAE